MKKIARQLTSSVSSPRLPADRQSDRADPRPGSDRGSALLGWKRLGDDRERRGHHECRADALNGAEPRARVARRKPDQQAR